MSFCSYLQVGPLTTPNITHCICDHLTSFAAGLFVMPNKLDLASDILLFATVGENPVVVSTVGAVWILFILVAIFMRRKDRADEIFVSPKLYHYVKAFSVHRITHQYIKLISTKYPR